MSAMAAGYLGPVASFSHQAALAVFPEDDKSSKPVQLKPLPTFTDIFKALQAREVDFGVIPIENSSNGSVVQTLDLLSDRSSKYTNIRIVGEYYLPVHHFLLARKLQNKSPQLELLPEERIKGIRKLYTHPQAWGQCERFLSQHLKGIERQDVSSTSRAAEIVSHEEHPSEPDGTYSAAIASDLAADLNNLDVLASNIEDSSDNVTRFFIFSRIDIPASSLSDIYSHVSLARQRTGTSSASTVTKPRSNSKHKSLLSFTVSHSHPGSLATALEVFKSHSLNLTSIDTRPSRQERWNYVFFVECESGDLSSFEGGPGNEAEGKEEKEIEGRKAGERGEMEERIGRLVKDLEKVTERSRVWGWWEDQA